MSVFDTAYLSNDGSYTLFSFNNTRLKFAAPHSLEKYEKVLYWDNGYLEVLAKYSHNSEPEEEYIDLIPIRLQGIIYISHQNVLLRYFMYT